MHTSFTTLDIWTDKDNFNDNHDGRCILNHDFLLFVASKCSAQLFRCRRNILWFVLDFYRIFLDSCIFDILCDLFKIVLTRTSNEISIYIRGDKNKKLVCPKAFELKHYFHSSLVSFFMIHGSHAAAFAWLSGLLAFRSKTRKWFFALLEENSLVVHPNASFCQVLLSTLL